MRYASLGSGSEGNGLLVQSGDGTSTTTVLIDCGFGLKAARNRMQALGIEPDALDAILVTHEHSDHIGGVFRLAAAHQITVYLTHGTMQATRAPARDKAQCELVMGDSPFDVGDMSFNPVPVPHDAREPVQYVIDDGRVKLGMLTDIGHATAHVSRAFSGLDALILECNHDTAMLAGNAKYPVSLKRRISGPFGHLSNDAAGALLDTLDRSRLKGLAAAHLSASNNTPDLARDALASVLDSRPDEIGVADQENGLAWSAVA